jgi:hypothetical protein
LWNDFLPRPIVLAERHMFLPSASLHLFDAVDALPCQATDFPTFRHAGSICIIAENASVPPIT